MGECARRLIGIAAAIDEDGTLPGGNAPESVSPEESRLPATAGQRSVILEPDAQVQQNACHQHCAEKRRD
jgi:hypothetical protein